MITLNVLFTHDEFADGTIMLNEILITGEAMLLINNNIYLNELQYFINKAENILKKRYNNVKVNIKWETHKDKEDE